MAKFRLIFRILSILFITSFIYFFYSLFKKQSSKILITTNDHYYRSIDDYAKNKNVPISTSIKVIPIPQVSNSENSFLTISNGFRIISKSNALEDVNLAIRRYSTYITLLTGISIDNDQNYSPSENKLIIHCSLTDSRDYIYPKVNDDESYMLKITSTGSYLNASTSTGIIRGLATFAQLIERNNASNTFYIPIVNIIDQPRFTWRGLMLDVCRHWMPISVIERTLNAMELSKLNVLHLHLSDDQGFRVESIQYNLLHDRTDFFTQKDVKHIVEYARQRRIRIVPEFDIPGHTTSWFVGYPDLAAERGLYQVETRWGVFKPTLDPTKESTYTFLDKFFEEMTALFPDPFFHIGGDEVEGTQWAQSASIQKFIIDNQLKNKNGLQAYFNKRVQALLKKYAKIMVGWEEIIDEIQEQLAVDKDAIIQSWKSREATINAVRKGYGSILSNGYYLDHLLSSITHYMVDPVTNSEFFSLNDEQKTKILGGEACMWSEFVTQHTVDSRIWPRVLAIAERLWSLPSLKDQNFLYERMFRMNNLLDKVKTGVTHISSYRSQLENLIIDSDQKMSLLHPFAILADACEPQGHGERSQISTYTSKVPLTTFADALKSESEFIWKLENLQITDRKLRDVFEMWSVNHAHLRGLFNIREITKQKQQWGQDVEKLSENLARTGQIGLKILEYNSKKILHHDPSDTMNSWPIRRWISHHKILLNQYEIEVREIRLAAVRPVRRLLAYIESKNL